MSGDAPEDYGLCGAAMPGALLLVTAMHADYWTRCAALTALRAGARAFGRDRHAELFAELRRAFPALVR